MYIGNASTGVTNKVGNAVVTMIEVTIKLRVKMQRNDFLKNFLVGASADLKALNMFLLSCEQISGSHCETRVSRKLCKHR